MILAQHWNFMLRLAELKKKGAQASDPAGQAFNKAIDTLRAKQFDCVDDLWESIGTKFANGISSLSTQTSVDKELLIQILAEGAYEPELVPDENRAKLKSYWPELLGAIILTLLAALLLSHAALRVDTVMVKTQLPAFHVIKEEDLEVKQTINIPGSLTSPSSVVGHYLLQQVPKGARLYANQISKVSVEDAAERQVLSVPIKAGGISPTLSPPDRVRLLFSPRRNETNNNTNAAANVTSIDDVIVLSINRQGDSSSIVVALKGDPVEVSKLLSTSEVIIAQPMSR
jgi:hypothetical protein